MAALTGNAIQATYIDILQCSNSNAGIDGTLRAVSDGEGTAAPLELSSSAVNISSGFQLNGTAAQSSDKLKHEVGGIEADISAIADGGMLVGTGAGTMAIRASALTAGAAGFLTHEVGGLEFDASAVADGDVVVGTGAGTMGLESGATVRTTLGLAIGTDVQAYDADTTKNDAANSFTADQTIVSTDAGAAEGPGLDIYRNSASPAASDVLGAVRFKGEDDGSNETTYVKWNAHILDPADGSEDGRLTLGTMLGGSLLDNCHWAGGMWMDGATGGDQGADTVNASGIYDDGNQIHAVQDGLATEQATTSGTSKTFSSIRADARRITIMLDGVSADGTDELLIQLGDSGGLETSGYDGTVRDSGSDIAALSAGFQLNLASAAGDAWHVYFQATLMDATNNTWVAHWQSTNGDTGAAADQAWGIGTKSLSATLTQLALLLTGSDNLDLGAVNILVE